LEYKICDESLWVNFDPIEIKQILSNLVKNASESIEENKTGKIIVELEADLVRSHCRLSVEDNGRGMTELESSKAADPFYSNKGVGRGLGLASVKGLVEKHSGSIDIVSGVNRGTKVSIDLELTSPEVQDSPSRETSAGSADSSVEFQRILLVEDDEQIRQSIEGYLKSQGIEVIAAENVDHAMQEMSDGKQFDCVISDFLLPEKNGQHFARWVKERFPGLAIVLVSGYAEQDAFDNELFDDFISKPFRFDDLMSRLNQLARRQQIHADAKS
ncbi:MAG: ATP-binding protein, partial [Planctomycetota bacterium]